MPTFASWVEPFATQYRENCDEAVRFARSLDAGAMATAAGDDGWSVRDELVHMAASAGDVQRVLGTIVRGERVDTSIFADIDARNARNLAAREGHSMDAIASEFEETGAALQEVLGQLTPEDENRQPEGMPFPLKGLLAGYAQHDPYHLSQIRTALGREPRS